MELINNINNTSVYRNPAPHSPLQGENVMQPATVYSKIMLRTIALEEKDYIFDSLASLRTMPANNGANEITFKRMLSLAAHTKPLVEGIPPASDQGRMVAIKAGTKSYGRVMKFTDKVEWAVVDPLISEYTRQLALLIPEMKDILAQEALLSEASLFYASEKEKVGDDPDLLVSKPFGDVAHIKFMNPDCSPTIDEFRRIVLSMETAKVRPYQGNNYLAIVTPGVLFDLITDKRVKEFMKYSNTAQAYTNDMVVDLFSLAFKKSKTAKSDNTYTDFNGNVCYVYHAPNMVVTVVMGADQAYTGPVNIISVGRQISEVELTDTNTIFEIVPLNRTITGEYAVAPFSLMGGRTAIENATKGTGYTPLNIHHSYVIGEECLFRIGIDGHSEPRFISKSLGSAGTEDPLDQRQSIGWKLDALGYKVPNPDAVTAYFSIPTNFRLNTNPRPDFRHQFTDYNYGYQDDNGNYYHPEQVMQTVEAGAVVHYVRGTTIKVEDVKLTQLIKPVNGTRIKEDGTNQVVHGNLPNTEFALASNFAITFMKSQITKHTDNKYYITGLEGNVDAEVVRLPQTVTKVLPSRDGTEMVDTEVTIDGTDVNKTGHISIDEE